ncbi:MAG: hypothetical protein IPP49_10710 [Saprospiraceae bacterium]|nr:hypothetical protein [Saprospiraceae bacterium]
MKAEEYSKIRPAESQKRSGTSSVKSQKAKLNRQISKRDARRKEVAAETYDAVNEIPIRKASHTITD